MYSNIKKSPNNPLIIRSLRAIQSQKLTIQHLSLKFYQKSFAMSQKIRTFAPDFLREFQNHKIFTHNILIIFKKSKYSFNMKIFKKKSSAKSILILALFAVVSSFWNYVDAKYTLTTSREVPVNAGSTKWANKDGVWYIYKGRFDANGSKSLGDDATPKSWAMGMQTVYCPNSLCYADIDYYAEESVVLVFAGQVSFYFNANETRKFTSELLEYTGSWFFVYNYSTYHENDVKVDPNTSNLSFGWNSGLSSEAGSLRHCTKKNMEVRLKVPYHMDSYESWDNVKSHLFNSIQNNSGESDTWTINLADCYKSYYTQSGITYSITGTNASMFSVTGGTISPGSIYANGEDCFGNSSETINSAPSVNVVYKPTAKGTHTAYFNILLDGKVVKSVLLNGTCYGKYYISMDFELSDLTSATYELPLGNLVTVRDRDNNVINTPVTLSVDASKTSVDYTLSTDNKLTIRTVGDFAITATASYQGPEDETSEDIYAAVETEVIRGTLVFDNHAGDNDWYNKNNWFPHNQAADDTKRVVPTAANHNVSIDAACNLSSAGHSAAECWNFGVTSKGQLNIGTDGVLNVANNALNEQSNASHLVLKASSSAQGTMLFHNSNTAAPFATVEMYVPRTLPAADFRWQYRGVPVVHGGLDFDGSVWAFQWSEPAGATEDAETWYEIDPASMGMSNWYGYCIAKVGGSDICSVEGQLINGNKQYLLDYSEESHPNRGYNLITNSYSAPLKVNALETADFVNADATIFLYNTGTYNEWKNSGKDNGLTQGTAPGQFTALTVHTSNYSIPAGESFFVVANAPDGYVSLSYDKVAASASGAFKAPREIEHFNTLGIIVEGKASADRLVLLESENCSSEFDNGYDGRKLFGAKGTPQLYATNDFGRTSLNVDRTFMGQHIGFRARSNGEKYTVSFQTDELEGYSKLYLYDSQTGAYVDILAGETYTFTETVAGNDKRFMILGERENGEIITGSDQRVEVIGSEALVCGFDDASEAVIISDMSGRMVWSSNTDRGPWFQLPDNLPSGVYILSVGKCETKFIR